MTNRNQVRRAFAGPACNKWQTHKDLSTDAEYRGGAIRSSDEGSVMELERRDCVVLLLHKNNPKGEDSVGKSKVV